MSCSKQVRMPSSYPLNEQVIPISCHKSALSTFFWEDFSGAEFRSANDSYGGGCWNSGKAVACCRQCGKGCSRSRINRGCSSSFVVSERSIRFESELSAGRIWDEGGRSEILELEVSSRLICLELEAFMIIRRLCALSLYN